MSPLGRLSVRALTPWLERRSGVGATGICVALLAGLVVAASREAVAAVCLGCGVDAAIWGCDDCGDIARRLDRSASNGLESLSAAASAATN